MGFLSEIWDKVTDFFDGDEENDKDNKADGKNNDNQNPDPAKHPEDNPAEPEKASPPTIGGLKIAQRDYPDEGKYLNDEERNKIIEEARAWDGTPYGSKDGSYFGANAVKGKGADCSGSTCAIYAAAGFPYDYKPANPNNGPNYFPKAVEFERLPEELSPRKGDVGWFGNEKGGHLAIFDDKAPKTTEGMTGDSWSARRPGVEFGSANTRMFEDRYGKPTWFRYVKEPGRANK